MNLLAVAVGYGFLQVGAGWLGAFVIANAVLFIGSASPSVSSAGGRLQKSDGRQILDLLFGPPVPRTNYDGAEMTADAYAVLARAGEEAQLSGAAEVTDETLLRALNKDRNIGALFAAVGLSGRIPPAGMPESDDLVTPRVSQIANAAVSAGFQRCRDMGIQKPNAAGFCLGLLAVDCPASRMMRDAGVTEDAVRKLAAVTTEDEEDLRRKRVLSADVPLERWGAAADRIVASAERIAAADHSPFVGTQHLVAAVVRDSQCRGAEALERAGFVLQWKREKQDPADALAEGERPVLSPQASLAIAGALWRTGPSFPTGTAEICLGILDQSAGAGAQILTSGGVSVSGFVKALRSTAREASEPAGCTESSLDMWMLRGSARVGDERWSEARADFVSAERVAKREDQRAICNNNIAWVSLMSGDSSLRAEALERSQIAISLKPDQVSFQGTHAFAVLENGSPAEAAAIIETFLPKQTRPRGRASDLCVLAICRARLGQPDEAARCIAEAVEADPRCTLLGRAREELGQAGAALSLSSPHGRRDQPTPQ
jgi:tetratricopeptide (TPR) repeat protein